MTDSGQRVERRRPTHHLTGSSSSTRQEGRRRRRGNRTQLTIPLVAAIQHSSRGVRSRHNQQSASSRSVRHAFSALH